MDSALRQRIQSIVSDNRVVLFMKGTKEAPRCGFSASVVQVLNDVGADFTDVDVLADPAIRDAIKEFSNWPTLPQLYVGGEFQGGADIVKEMYGKGELHKMLGVAAPEAVVPTITLSAAAQAALTEARAEAEEPFLRLEIDAGFRHNLYFDAKKASDVEVRAGELVIVLDAMSSRRADGLQLDFVEGPGGTGFKIENPNAPARVKAMNVQELKRLLDAGEKVELFDTRGEDERAIAKIAAARIFDQAAVEHIRKLPKNARLVFMCHHGGRSAAAAQEFLGQGYANVFNVAGGIDAWSREIDSSVPKY